VLDTIVGVLSDAGIRVLLSADALLRDLAEIAYEVTGEDVARCVQWFRESSNAVSHVARYKRLPAPVRKLSDGPLGPRMSCLPWRSSRVRATSRSVTSPHVPLSFRWIRPDESVYAGSVFLSADGLELGATAALTSQQLALIFFASVFVANVICVVLSLQHDSDILFNGFNTTVDVAFLFSILFVVVFLSPLVLALAFPLLGDLDARSRHSELLVPLHVAAYMKQAAAGTSSASLNICFLLSRPEAHVGQNPSEEYDPHLRTRIENVRNFLLKIGLDARIIDPRPDGTCDDRSISESRPDSPVVISVCVYVLRSEAAATAWCATQYTACSAQSGKTRVIPHTRQLLVVDHPANKEIFYPTTKCHGQVRLRDTVYSE
jgi:hypothetical protein